MRRISVFIILSTLLALLGVGGTTLAQVDVRPWQQETAAGPVRGMVAIVHLDDPRVSVHVTGPLNIAAATQPVSPEVNARLQATDKWAQEQHMTLAVNGGYFGWVKGGAHVLGYSVSDGAVVAPPRQWDGKTDPAIVFLKDKTAHVIGPGQPDVNLADVREAVAGIGGSPTDKARGSLLVQNGRNLGSTARVFPDDLHGRTAVGVDASGTTVYVVVIDGRQPGWSIGMTLPTLADMMIGLGANDAINLDGGGSSSFVYRPSETAPAVTNRPSDEFNATRPGIFRAVPNHLGFKVAPAAPAAVPANAASPAARPRRKRLATKRGCRYGQRRRVGVA